MLTHTHPSMSACVFVVQARVAVQFVINFEEGGEGCVLHGDAASEHLLTEIVGATPVIGGRSMNIESLYVLSSFFSAVPFTMVDI